jgi:hypothetical protein
MKTIKKSIHDRLVQTLICLLIIPSTSVNILSRSSQLQTHWKNKIELLFLAKQIYHYKLTSANLLIRLALISQNGTKFTRKVGNIFLYKELEHFLHAVNATHNNYIWHNNNMHFTSEHEGECDHNITKLLPINRI